MTAAVESCRLNSILSSGSFFLFASGSYLFGVGYLIRELLNKEEGGLAKDSSAGMPVE
jgi:hypothetical protein